MVYLVETRDTRYDASGRCDSFSLNAQSFDRAVKRAKEHIKMSGSGY